MEHVTEILVTAFGGIAFCIAVVLLLSGAKRLTELTELQTDTKDAVIYEGYVEALEPVVTAEDLTAMLMSRKLDAPVEINGVLITNETVGSTDIAALRLNGTFYHAVIYDELGNIEKYVYKER